MHSRTPPFGTRFGIETGLLSSRKAGEAETSEVGCSGSSRNQKLRTGCFQIKVLPARHAYPVVRDTVHCEHPLFHILQRSPRL